MKSPKQLWIAALCLCSALAIAAAFTSRTNKVQAAQHADQLKRPALAQPAAYVASPTLRAALAADAMADVGPDRVTANLHANPMLPDAEEFTLTPPDRAQGTNKTTLAVRFAEADAATLAAQIPMTLAGQNVMLQRSTEDASVFSTHVDFDWTVFLKMQQRRKEMASQGKTVPIYQGRDFIRRETLEFVEPSEIEQALQSHEPIHFTSDVLIGGYMLTVAPDHELMIINPAVVEDTENGSGRTYDTCLSNLGKNPGNPTGAWTFQTLWMAAINTTDVHVAQLALRSFLANWQNNQMVNGLTVALRPGMGSLGVSPGLLGNWPIDDSHGMCNGMHCPSLQAPVRLNAIVNRIDLAAQPNQTQAGELRFVFGVTSGIQAGDTCSTQGPPLNSPPPFNIIFEYHVPSQYTATSWASQWNLLPQGDFGYCQTCYVPQLQSLITNNVVKNNSCSTNINAKSCLFHIRTNEVLLTGTPAIWEEREFTLNYVQGGPNTISEVAVDQTPDNTFNFGGGPCLRQYFPPNGEPPCNNYSNATADYINTYGDQIYTGKGITPLIPQQVYSPPDGMNIPFQGGSSLNAFQSGTFLSASYWNTCLVGHDTYCTQHILVDSMHTHGFAARRYLSLNTCNGCHGEETTTNFFQVFNRLPTYSSNLSNFLLGCAPSGGQTNCSFNNYGNDQCTPGGSDQCTLNQPGGESVKDLVDPSHPYNTYGDIALRLMNLQGLDAPVNEFFLPFMRPHIGVH